MKELTLSTTCFPHNSGMKVKKVNEDYFVQISAFISVLTPHIVTQLTLFWCLNIFKMCFYEFFIKFHLK